MPGSALRDWERQYSLRKRALPEPTGAPIPCPHATARDSRLIQESTLAFLGVSEEQR